MSEELKEHNSMRIVAAMKKSACFLLFLLVAAPAFAQSQQFGILLGGAKRLYSGHDKEAAQAENNVEHFAADLPIDRFRLTSGVREVFYAVQIEPATWFKIQAGQWTTDVGIVQSGLELSKPDHPPTGDPARFPTRGTIQHADGIIDYRFSEPYGTSGLFAGIGLYRWSAPTPAAGDEIHSVPTETNYGYTFGVNSEFPMTKRYAFMVEGAYHWINMSSPVRYVTLTGGVRIGF